MSRTTGVPDTTADRASKPGAPASSGRGRGLLRGLGLLLSGAVVVALCLGVAGLASLRPASAPTSVAPAAVSVGSGATTWVCGSAPALPTAGAGADVEYDPALGTGGGSVSTAVQMTAIGADDAPRMVMGVLGEDGVEAESSGDMSGATLPDVADPVVAVVEPTAAGVPLVAGTSTARADTGDLRGLSVAACQQPVTSAYLVGGSTELGSSARLVLSNPGDTAASVRLSGWGATGPLTVNEAPVVVPAGGVRAVLLETISLEARLAVRIDVEGGRVVPTLQDSSLDGLIAAGTETIGVTADPATTVTVPGVALTDDAGATASLRLVNPGEAPATLSVELLGPEGVQPLEGAVDSVVEAGTVVDISLAGVPAGSYAVRVTSDQPVTGAVQMQRTGTAGEDDPDTPPVDVGWMPAAAPIDAGAVPIPTQLVDGATVTVTNPAAEAAPVTVTGYGEDGTALEESTAQVPAGATVAVTVPAGSSALVLEGTGFLAGAVLTADAADGPLISAVSVVPDPYVEQSVVVRVDG